MQVNNNIYGVESNGAHTDVSKSLKATKRYATMNGHNTITIRYNSGYNAEIIFVKYKNVWKPFDIDTYKEITKNQNN